MVGFVRRTFVIGALAGVGGAAALIAGTRSPAIPPVATQPAMPRSSTTAPFVVAPPPPHASAAEVEALVAKLASDAWKERQAAQDRLIAFGPDVAPRLQKLARESKDQEVITRAQGALRLIDENRLLGPTLVTIHVKDAPAQQVFKELARQAQTDIPPEPPELWTQHEWPKVTLNADRVEFWTVFREACSQAGVEPEQSDNLKMRLSEAEPPKPFTKSPAITRGAFILLAEGAERRASLRFADAGNVERGATLTMHAIAEPKLRLIRDSAAAVLEEAVDDHGNSLLPVQEGIEPSLSTAGDNGREWDLTIQLEYPAKNPGTSIARLRGKLQFLAPVRVETLEVENILLARNLPRTIAGRRFLFRSARKNGNGYEVKLTAYRDGLPDADWQQITSPHDFIRLADDKDRPIPFSGVSDSDGGEKQITFTLQFETPTPPGNPNASRPADVPGKPSKLVWDIPVETRVLQVPFEFDNNLLKLP